MILVTGATGLTGGAIVRKLSERGVAVRALVRSASKAEALARVHDVTIAVGDMAKPETLGDALRGIDRAMLISSSAPSMLEVQTTFVDAARTAGVAHVVKLSGIIPDVDSAFRFARMHGLAEKHLEASGMIFTHLRAGEFMPAYFRQIPNIVGKNALMLPMATARIASIDVGDLADVAAHVLTTSGHDRKIYRLTGPEASSMDEIAQKLSSAIGRTIRYVDVPPEDARRAQVAAGMPEYLADGLFELFAERRAGKESTVFADVSTLLGRSATTFDEFAARNAAVFRGEKAP
jgi:uncharacterized protein YbjT (DUF2867 family)